VSLVATGEPSVLRALGSLTRLHRRHPEWPVLLLAAAGWFLLLRGHLSAAGHHGHVAAAPAAAFADWCVMVLAMMVPAAVPAVRRVAFDSLRRRRLRAMTVFLAGYVALWVAFGLATIALITAVDAVPAVDRGLVAAALLLVAAGYELTSRKRRFLRSCHLPAALPPTGWRADAACARFGVRQACACLGSCGLLMLAMAAAGHGALLLVVLVSAIVAARTLLVAGTKLGRPAAVALLVASLILVTA
jgi:predicted metal-binding membrane protein